MGVLVFFSMVSGLRQETHIESPKLTVLYLIPGISVGIRKKVTQELFREVDQNLTIKPLHNQEVKV